MKKEKEGSQREDRSSVRHKRFAWHAVIRTRHVEEMRYGEAHTREKEWKWKVRLTTGVANGFTLGISAP